MLNCHWLSFWQFASFFFILKRKLTILGICLLYTGFGFCGRLSKEENPTQCVEYSITCECFYFLFFACLLDNCSRATIKHISSSGRSPRKRWFSSIWHPLKEILSIITGKWSFFFFFSCEVFFFFCLGYVYRLLLCVAIYIVASVFVIVDHGRGHAPMDTS